MGEEWHEFFKDFPDQDPANWVNGEYQAPDSSTSTMWDWVDASEMERCAKKYLSALLTGDDQTLLTLGLIDLDALAEARSSLLGALDGPFVQQEVLTTPPECAGDYAVDIRLTTSDGKSATVRLALTSAQEVESLTVLA